MALFWEWEDPMGRTRDPGTAPFLAHSPAWILLTPPTPFLPPTHTHPLHASSPTQPGPAGYIPTSGPHLRRALPLQGGIFLLLAQGVLLEFRGQGRRYRKSRMTWEDLLPILAQ